MWAAPLRVFGGTSTRYPKAVAFSMRLSPSRGYPRDGDRLSLDNKVLLLTILLENEVPGQSRSMSEFFGSIPDFPEREDQGTHEPMKMGFPRQFG